MLDTLQSTAFEAHLDQDFQIQSASGGPWPARLVEVNPLKLAPSGEGDAIRRRAFAIVFRLPSECQLPQGTYRVQHEQLGALDLFLVPIGPDQAGLRYEAVFT